MIDTGSGRQVFISYASADAEAAHRLVAVLELHGIRCWIAPRDVVAGAQYADAIVRAISDAPVFLVLLSAHSIASSHVGREVERAGSKTRRLLALRLDSAPLTPALEYFLGESQWVDLAQGEPGAHARLLQAIRQDSEPVAAIAVLPARANAGKRMRIALAASAALALAGFLGWKFVLPSGSPGHSPSSSAVAQAATKSIAVLPFTDMSERKDQEYLGDGMAEEILDLLAKVPGLTVIGRTSSFQFKGKNEDLRAIGAKLNAAYVLEGSVRRSGDQVRITAQLIDTRSGAHEWSETYDRRYDDVLRLQDAIAAAVAREMQLSVDAAYLGSRGALKDAAAYDLMLRARHAGDRWDSAGLDEAILLLKQALERDPTSTAVASQLAMMYVREGEAGYLLSTEAFEQARQAADAAISLDAKNALAHNVLARIHIIYDWDWDAAAKELRQASLRVPGEGGALDTEALLSIALGRWDDALRQINLAIAQDPLDPKNFFALGELKYRLGRNSEAEAAYRRVLDIHPTFPWAHVSIGLVRIARGEGTAALAEMDQEPVEIGKQLGLVAAYHALGRHADSDAALNRLLGRETRGSAYMIAQAYAHRGQAGEALHWLDQARAEKDPFLFYANVELTQTPLGTSPEFTSFLRRMKLVVDPLQ